MSNKKPGSSFYYNTLAQTAGRLLYLLSRVGLPPLILHYVSLDEYGLWSTCFLLISYVSMGAFGVSNVYIRYVAEYSVKHQYDDINGLVSTGLMLTFAFSVLALGGVWLAMPLLLKSFNVAPALQHTAEVLILGTLATMLLDMTLGAFSYVLHGLQKIAEQTIVWIVSFLLETVLIIALLVYGFGVTSLLWAFLARYIFSTVFYIILCYRAIPTLHISLRLVNRDFFSRFLHYGGILQLSGLLSVFMYSIERVIAGYLTGLGAIAVLDLGQKFPVMASQVFSSMNASFLPAITEAHSLGKYQDIQRLYLQGLRYLSLLNGLAMGFLAPFAVWLLHAWLGHAEQLESTIMVMFYACVGYQLNVMTGPLSAYYQGINHPMRTFGYLGWQILFIIGGLAWAWYYTGFDVIIIAAITMWARALSALVYLFKGNAQLGLPHRSFILAVLLPGAMPYLWGYGIMLAIEPWLVQLHANRWLLIPLLGGIGLVYTLLTVSFFYQYMCNAAEQVLIRQKLRLKA
ncbi:MAG: oligosaccharide flippase family protein [Methylococcales bacterium]|nr:oligosaccharide flippase family protein [Methylococcales bacterium]